MNLRLRAFPDRGPLVWFAFSAGIAAWIVHLTLFASIVALVHRHGYFWIFHVGNAGALVLTLLATWMCWRMVRDADAYAGPDWPAERIRFLGHVGLLVNAINLLLIVTEGSYVYFIRTGG
jgi:hypothetical protein